MNNHGKFDRRQFAKYLTHGFIAGALSRTLVESSLFAATGKTKLLICTSPNGHFSSEATQAAFKGVIDAQKDQNYSLYLTGLRNSCYSGDWHGAESGLFGFRDGKGSAPSFFSAFSNLDKTYLTIDGSRYPRDSAGGEVTNYSKVKDLLEGKFSQAGTGTNSNPSGQAGSNSNNIIDPLFSDVKKVKSLLGAGEGNLFEDYVDSLQELRNKMVSSDNSESEAAEPVSADQCGQLSTLSDAADKTNQHSLLLDAAHQLLACNLTDVVVVSYLNSESEPEHQSIHGAGSNDGGMLFKSYTDATQKRIGEVINKMSTAPGGLLEQGAVVYISGGSGHLINGSFNNGHPDGNIPCAVFGRLNGQLTTRGVLDSTGQDQRNLWRSLVDKISGNTADLSKIGGQGILPLKGI